jgi:hypothetical protein
MKKVTLILMLACFGVMASAQAQNAGEYMNVFSTEYSKIQQDMWDYTSSVSHGKSARKVEKRRMELIQTSNTALNKAKSQKGFNGSTQYKDSVVEYLKIVNLVLKEDYAKIVDMEEIAENSYDLMEAYMTAREQASDKLVEASKMVAREQKRFAEANNVTLIESESALDGKMEVAGKVYDHYNEVYLIFFKSFKQEAYLIDAISKNDINAIEQNREALKTTAEDGLKKLEKVALYNNDRSLVVATNDLLKFYITEAEKETPKIADFILKSENFNQIKATFEKKSEKSRTQADVDGYNKAVNEMNAAVNVYNATNESLNKTRSKNIENWNKVAQAFTDKHVPKGK